MGMLMSKPCKLASIILSSLYSLFSLENGRSLTVHPLRKYEQGFNAFESNTGKLHPLASKPANSNKRRDGATVSLTKYRPNTPNTMWYGNISVGTPAAIYTGQSLFRVAQTQKLIAKCAVDFETGSADFFLPGPSCPNCEGHDIYNPAQSSTSKDLGTTTTLTYNDGKIEGELYTDNVVVGGFKVSGCWVSGQVTEELRQ